MEETKKAFHVNKKFNFKGVAIGDLSKEKNVKSVVKDVYLVLRCIDL